MPIVKNKILLINYFKESKAQNNSSINKNENNEVRKGKVRNVMHLKIFKININLTKG